ncbi:hypothetical protein FRC07_008949 [Ceratobasidium sp. 392]|nr:hypothetical protein FRC07_008949 [Ceratobasidium sp. 392]
MTSIKAEGDSNMVDLAPTASRPGKSSFKFKNWDEHLLRFLETAGLDQAAQAFKLDMLVMSHDKEKKLLGALEQFCSMALLTTTTIMGKKNKNKEDDTGLPPTIPNRDLMQRMSFLYQASVCLQNVARTRTETNGGTEMRRLARKHVKTLKGIASGAVVKIDPSVKRVLCKKCNTILVPGPTASVRVKTSGPHGKIVSYTCFSCNERRVIPAPPTKQKLGNSAQDREASPSQGQAKDDSLTGRKSKARPEPFFARTNAGHVVYRGTERVEASDG